MRLERGRPACPVCIPHSAFNQSEPPASAGGFEHFERSRHATGPFPLYSERMDFPITRTFALMFVTILFLLLLGGAEAAFGQKTDTENINVAISRSKKAAEIIKVVMSLPDGKGIPKDVTEQAKMIGVVPSAFELSLAVIHAVRGHGVFSVRRESGWTLPAFYFYGGTGGPSKPGTKNFDIIFVVVDAKLNGDKTNKPKSDDKKKVDKSKLFLYTFADGELAPMKAVETRSFFIKSPNAKYDDSLNKLVYGSKGEDIASGKASNPKLTSPDVAAFRDALTELYPQK